MEGLTHHVIQRGNNRCDIFRCNDDYEFFLAALGVACQAEHVEVHSYTLMTNHVHLLLTPRKEGAVSLAMQDIGRTYVGVRSSSLSVVQLREQCVRRRGQHCDGASSLS